MPLLLGVILLFLVFSQNDRFLIKIPTPKTQKKKNDQIPFPKLNHPFISSFQILINLFHYSNKFHVFDNEYLVGKIIMNL